MKQIKNNLMQITLDQKHLPEWEWDGNIGIINDEVNLKVDNIYCRLNLNAECSRKTVFYEDSEPETEVQNVFVDIEDIEFFNRYGKSITVSDNKFIEIEHEIINFFKNELL